jgi:hypothetical protein
MESPVVIAHFIPIRLQKWPPQAILVSLKLFMVARQCKLSYISITKGLCTLITHIDYFL